MKLDEAIEIQETYIREKKLPALTKLEPAMKLGIEAMKAVEKMRHYPFPDEILKLPGED